MDFFYQHLTPMKDSYNVYVFLSPYRQGQLSEEAKTYEEQLRHNTVVMMEMQDTINELQRELSALGKTPRRPLSENMSTPGGSVSLQFLSSLSIFEP